MLRYYMVTQGVEGLNAFLTYYTIFSINFLEMEKKSIKMIKYHFTKIILAKNRRSFIFENFRKIVVAQCCDCLFG